MDNHPSFRERADRMEALAGNLTAMANLTLKFAEEIAAEAARMKLAADRFEKHHAARSGTST